MCISTANINININTNTNITTNHKKILICPRLEALLQPTYNSHGALLFDQLP